ncbi:hypothetical protein FZ938_27595 [Azospirillum oryzae]|nr:hypothetical protein FZ938_27595 [Azospirillum oryzae]
MRSCPRAPRGWRLGGVPVKRPAPLEGFRTCGTQSNVWNTNYHDTPHFPLRFWIDPITVYEH